MDDYTCPDESLDDPRPIVDHADLFDFIDKELANHHHFCDTYAYRQWEQEVARPALEAAGFRLLHWSTGERDSFGPLSRVCHAVRGNQNFQLFYG